jgi:hypothetical protein
MAVTLHRCPLTFVKTKGHGCWQVEKALQDAGVEYRSATRWGLPRSRRTDIITGTGQAMMPAIQFEDGTWYRQESKDMAAHIRAGRLLEGKGAAAAPPAAAEAQGAEPAESS